MLPRDATAACCDVTCYVGEKTKDKRSVSLNLQPSSTPLSIMTAEQVVERLATLNAFQLDDDQCSVEGPALAVRLDSTMDPNWEDRNAFDTKWTEETHFIQKLVFFIKIYT